MSFPKPTALTKYTSITAMDTPTTLEKTRQLVCQFSTLNGMNRTY